MHRAEPGNWLLRSPQPSPCLCHQSVVWKWANCLSSAVAASILHLKSSLCSMPNLSEKLGCRCRWVQSRGKKTNLTLLDCDFLHLHGEMTLGANNNTTTFYSLILLCLKERIWPSFSLDKPLSCESCFDLCLRMTGCRWPKESAKSPLLPAPAECWVFLSCIQVTRTAV